MFRSIIVGYQLRNAWWYTASSRSRTRFARTKLGSLWLGVSSLLVTTILVVVYGTVFQVESPREYFTYLALGLSSWNYISASIISAPDLFDHNKDNIKNNNINPIFYALEEWSFQLQTFIQIAIVMTLAIAIVNPSTMINILLLKWILPFINLVLLMYWVPLLICIAGSKYRDLYQLIPAAVQLLFLITPVLYKKQSLGGFEWIAQLNPVFIAINPLRESIIGNDASFITWPIVCVMIINVIGCVYSTIMLDKTRYYLPTRL